MAVPEHAGDVSEDRCVFNLWRGVYEMVMLSSMFLICDHTWWLPYLRCLKCDLIAFGFLFYDKINVRTLFCVKLVKCFKQVTQVEGLL
jgi:hypothetical protein